MFERLRGIVMISAVHKRGAGSTGVWTIHVFLLFPQVTIHIPTLPTLGPSDKLTCKFDSFVTDAVVNFRTNVTCSLLGMGKVPPTPEQQGRCLKYYQDKTQSCDKSALISLF